MLDAMLAAYQDDSPEDSFGHDAGEEATLDADATQEGEHEEGAHQRSSATPELALALSVDAREETWRCWSGKRGCGSGHTCR